jgi:leucyl-tRNA synthetase
MLIFERSFAKSSCVSKNGFPKCITNLLSFFLYIHQAIFGAVDNGRYLPKGIRSNGHAVLNGEKMSKSTGMFLTLDGAVKKVCYPNAKVQH